MAKIVVDALTDDPEPAEAPPDQRTIGAAVRSYEQDDLLAGIELEPRRRALLEDFIAEYKATRQR